MRVILKKKNGAKGLYLSIYPDKVCLVKAMVFPVVMYGYESWIIKKAECWRIDALVLEKTLESPLDARRSNQSILKEISPNIHWKDWCWSWNSNTWATWCEELTHLKRPWCWARLKAGGEGDNRGWDGGMTSPTQWTWVWVNSGSWWWTGRPSVLQSMGRKESDTTEWLNWTELIYPDNFCQKSMNGGNGNLFNKCNFIEKMICQITNWRKYLQ